MTLVARGTDLGSDKTDKEWTGPLVFLVTLETWVLVVLCLGSRYDFVHPSMKIKQHDAKRYFKQL